MKLEDFIKDRSQNQCELSGETNGLSMYVVMPKQGKDEDATILISQKALAQIEKQEEPDAKYWENILPTAMWSEVPAVQVVAWRMLNRFKNETWAADALDILYLEDNTLEWAKASGDHLNDGVVEFHRDVNGTILQNGDSVTLVKDLDVKGSSLTAKMGTTVRNIRLDSTNFEYIEGKVDGQSIVIITKYVRKIG
ncbi:MAG TPA: PhnA domain-containing protein [Crocinitomicaceae bacterium]|nr:PhnA domain-containing protein [Crocinitomicaceae bacterium]